MNIDQTLFTISFFYQQEINPSHLVEYLQELGSPRHIIQLAESMRSEKGKITLTDDRETLDHWKKGFMSIKQETLKRMDIFNEKIAGFASSAPPSISELENELHMIGYALLSRLSKLQENTSLLWQKNSSQKPFLSALEIFFRNGELLRFQDNLMAFQQWLLRSSSSRKDQQIQADLFEKIALFSQALHFILHFYNQKWMLLLSPSLLHNKETIN